MNNMEAEATVVEGETEEVSKLSTKRRDLKHSMVTTRMIAKIEVVVEVKETDSLLSQLRATRITVMLVASMLRRVNQ